MYLEECLVFLQHQFKSDWLDDCLTHDEISGNVDINAEFDTKIHEVVKTFSDYFIKSIITGEYTNQLKFNSILEKLEQHIKNSITVDLVHYNTSVFDKLNLINRTLNDFIHKYIGFQKHISSYGSNSNSHLVYKYEKLNKPNEYSSDFLETFLAFIYIYSFEHFLSEKLIFIEKILEIENQLEEIISPTNNYYQIFRAKVVFLKFKLLYRCKLNLDRNNDSILNFTNKTYLINNEEVSLHSMPSNPVQYEKLKTWEKYLINHYSYTIDFQHFNNEYNLIKNIRIENRSILQLHFCIKYFKDISRNRENLVKIVAEIEKRFNFSEGNFVYSKIYLYALNNLFSFFCDNKESDGDIQELYNKIESIQANIQNKNFFCSLKLLEVRSSKLCSELETNKNIISLDLKKYNFEDIEKLIDKTKNRLEWSQSHQNLVFQLDFEDSLVDVSELNLSVDKIYFPSSFILPIATEENNDKFKEITGRFQENKVRFELYNKLQPNFKELSEAKEEIKAIEKKSIETITIFTAIISFIVGSTGAFQFIKSFSEVILFITLFATSISLFVLLVFASTKGMKSLRKNWYIIAPYFVLWAFIYYYAMPNYRKDITHFSKEQSIYLTRKLDSIQKLNDRNFNNQKKIIDSVIIKTKPNQKTIIK